MAGPRIAIRARGGREVVIVLDNGTASLTESPQARNRLEEAKALAREDLAALGPAARAAVVSTSPSPHVVARMGAPGEAAGSLGDVEAVQLTGSMAGAISLALAEGAGEVAVFTSRAVPAAPGRVRRVGVGRASANVGIVRADFSDSEAFCAVKSFDGRSVEARVVLRALEPPSRALAGRTIRLEPLGRADVILAPEGDAAAALAAARAVALEVSSPADDLAADNRASAARAGAGARRVGLVGAPGEPLLRALRAARVDTVSLAGAGVPDNVDAVVYTVDVPTSWPPPRPALLVAPGRGVGPLEILDDELRDQRGLLVATESARSPTRGFPLVEIACARARRVRILGAAEALVRSGGEILAAEIAGAGVPVFYLGFRPEDSDWPERASFPVFVARLLESFGPRGGTGGRLEFARVGDVPAERLPPGAATLRLPGGPEVARGGRIVEAGLYRGGDALLAANLVSEAESDNRPAPDAPPRAAGGRDEATAAETVAARGLGWAVAAAALALLAAEWLVSARRS